ncbi:MAG: SDR family oxidoreductase [Actinobacteria bacterium]|nr:MAG: SDR family oxidoreductase [Actinomycetota bacterium]
MTGRLVGRVALISGAARGQGAVEARMFVEEGARVVLGDVIEDELRATADAINATHPRSATAVVLDVTRPDQWMAAVAVAEREFGGLHILVNNAGITNERYGGLCDIEDMPLDAWNALLNVNLTGVFLGMKSAIPLLRSSIRPLYEQNPRLTASIVNISSAQAIRPSPGQSNYAASKWAVRGLTKVAASELGPMIRVNSVHPGPIDTPMISEMLKTNLSVLQGLIAETPLERVGTAEEVASLVLFLASDESSYCTGAEFLVEGGRTAATVAKK